MIAVAVAHRRDGRTVPLDHHRRHELVVLARGRTPPAPPPPDRPRAGRCRPPSRGTISPCAASAGRGPCRSSAHRPTRSRARPFARSTVSRMKPSAERGSVSRPSSSACTATFGSRSRSARSSSAKRCWSRRARRRCRCSPARWSVAAPRLHRATEPRELGVREERPVGDRRRRCARGPAARRGRRQGSSGRPRCFPSAPRGVLQPVPRPREACAGAPARARPSWACAPWRWHCRHATRDSPSRPGRRVRPGACALAASMLGACEGLSSGAGRADEMYPPAHDPSSDAN